MNMDQENMDELKSRNQIKIAVSQIRNSLRTNKLLFQHNIEYGFFRNLLGGSLFAVICSIIIIVFAILQREIALQNTGIILVFIYVVQVILSKVIIKKLGYYYSKTLYEQFLTL